MEPIPKKRIKLTSIGGSAHTDIKKNTALYEELLQSYEEKIMESSVEIGRETCEHLMRLAWKFFNNCKKTYLESIEFKNELENRNSLGIVAHLRVIFAQLKAHKNELTASRSKPKNDEPIGKEPSASCSADRSSKNEPSRKEPIASCSTDCSSKNEPTASSSSAVFITKPEEAKTHKYEGNVAAIPSCSKAGPSNDEEAPTTLTEAATQNDSLEDHLMEDYNTDLFKKFVDSCKERLSAGNGSYLNNEKMIVKVWRYFNNCKTSYKKSPQFEKLLRESINASTVNPTIQLRIILNELKFNKKVVKRTVTSDSNKPCPSSTATNASESGTTNAEEDVSDTDSLSGLDKDTKRKVKILEKTLRLLNIKIRVLEEKEEDIANDDFDDENSAYIQLDRYYARIAKVYEKICKLKKKRSDAGRMVKRNVNFSGGEIERALENKYNQTRLFPDFTDVLTLTKEVKKNENLPPHRLNAIAEKIFKDFGRMLQRLRQRDVLDSACAYLASGPDPAEENVELKSKLDENAKISEINEQRIIDLFAEKSVGGAEDVDCDDSDDTKSKTIDEITEKELVGGSEIDDDDDATTGENDRKVPEPAACPGESSLKCSKDVQPPKDSDIVNIEDDKCDKDELGIQLKATNPTNGEVEVSSSANSCNKESFLKLHNLVGNKSKGNEDREREETVRLDSENINRTQNSDLNSKKRSSVGNDAKCGLSTQNGKLISDCSLGIKVQPSLLVKSGEKRKNLRDESFNNQMKLFKPDCSSTPHKSASSSTNNEVEIIEVVDESVVGSRKVKVKEPGNAAGNTHKLADRTNGSHSANILDSNRGKIETSKTNVFSAHISKSGRLQPTSTFRNNNQDSSPLRISSAFSLAQPSHNLNPSQSKTAPRPLPSPNHSQRNSTISSHQQSKHPAIRVKNISELMTQSKSGCKPRSTQPKDAYLKVPHKTVSETHRPSCSRIPKPHDVITIDDKCDDESSDILFVSEVKPSTKKGSNARHSNSQPGKAKVLCGDKVKIVPEMSMENMLKQGNVKVFQRSIIPTSTKPIENSVITLD